ncbi:MAG: HNH endonuclease [Clostridia bacterium]|nr:HNH endonuclease [Clostridia bacterium]
MKDLNWRDIPGYEGRYQISRMGEVRSLRSKHGLREKPKMLRAYTHNRKQHGSMKHQYYVKITDAQGKARDKQVHILMRDTWMGGPRKGMVVYHKNGDLKDNCLNNLDFITRRELGKKTGRTSKRRPVVKVNPAGEIVACYPSARQAAKENYLSYQTVMDRCNGKIKKPFALDGHTYQWDE